MNKDQLAYDVALRKNLGKRQAREVVDTVFDIIKEQLLVLDEVNIVGFGKFEVKDRKARSGRNPQTGDVIELPATRRIAFTPSKGFNHSVKGKK